MQQAPQAEHSTGRQAGWHPFADGPTAPGTQASLAAYKAQTLALLNQERAALGALLHQLRPGRPPLRPF